MAKQPTNKPGAGDTTTEDKRKQAEADLEARRKEEARKQAEADAQVDREIAEAEASAEANAKTEGDHRAEEQAVAEKNGPASTLEEMAQPTEELEDLDDEVIPDTLFVQDLTSKKPKEARVHQLIFDGVTKDFPFLPNERVEMPFAHACKFLVDPAFVVTDHDGKRYVPSPKRVKASDIARLGPDQVIAGLNELGTEALYVRAVKFPDGEKLNRATSRAELIEFLIAAHALSDGGDRKADERFTDGRVEEMDDSTVARMLG